MAETEIKAAAMLGLEALPAENVLRLRFRDGQQNAYRLDLPEAMLGGLLVSLVQSYAQLRGSGGQVMTLTASRSFTLPDGRVGLELVLDDALRLPVLLPTDAIPALSKSLEKLQSLSTQSRGAGPTRQ